jgi:CRP/FNR family transcriptional regulator
METHRSGDAIPQQLKAFPFLQELSPHSRNLLLSQALRRSLQGGEILAPSGRACSYLPLVLNGALRVYQASESGRQLTLYRIERGESCILSATCILNGGRFPAVAEAEEATELLLVPARLFASLVEGDPQWRRFVFALYARRLESVLALVQEVAFQRVDARLALYIASGAPTVNRTHARIASELGTSREVVTRLLKELESEGLVAVRRGRIEVLDPAGLRDKAKPPVV